MFDALHDPKVPFFSSIYLLIYLSPPPPLSMSVSWQVLWTDDGRLSLMRSAHYLSIATTEVEDAAGVCVCVCVCGCVCEREDTRERVCG